MQTDVHSVKSVVAKAVIAALVLVTLNALSPSQADAATLTFRALFPSRIQADVASGVTYSLAFTPATTTTDPAGAVDNSVILRFTDATDTEWCRTAGSLTITGFTNDFTGTAPAALPSSDSGAPTGTCVQGTGATDYDYLEIEQVGTITAGTKYGFTATANTAVLGTSDTGANQIYRVCTDDTEGMDDQCTGATDTAFGALDLIADDTVSVTAAVSETFDFTLGSTTCTLGSASDPIVTGTNIGACRITLTTTTNAADGYVVTARDESTGLDDGTNNIDDVAAGGSIDNTSEEFGISTEDSGVDIDEFTSNGGDIAGTDCTGGGDNTPTGPLSAFDPLTTTNQSVVETATPVSAEAFDICMAAGASATTVATDAYTDEVTFIASGYF